VKTESEAEKGGYIDQEKILEFENEQAIHFKIFVAICFLATFEIILFFPFAYSSFMLRKQFGYFNSKLILFPLLLPIFILLSFISFRIMESMKNDIRALEGKKYHFKKL
jgi:integral membrane sensor domain MASE1